MEIVEVGLGFGDAIVIVAGGDGADEVDPVWEWWLGVVMQV